MQRPSRNEILPEPVDVIDLVSDVPFAVFAPGMVLPGVWNTGDDRFDKMEKQANGVH